MATVQQGFKKKKQRSIQQHVAASSWLLLPGKQNQVP
jgi:hypothetical protein